MTFNKPFNEDERAYIRRNWGYMTYGDMARELNIWYKPYNEGKRTADGVADYIAEMNGSVKVKVELSRNAQDVIKDAGHTPAEVEKAIAQSVKEGMANLITNGKKQGKHARA